MTQFELKYSLGMATGQVFSYPDPTRGPDLARNNNNNNNNNNK